MRKSFMSITMLVVSISLLIMFVFTSTTCAQNSSKFIYNRADNVETIYTIDASKKHLTPKLKYEYNTGTTTQTTTKTAYRWNAEASTWEPYYLLTLSDAETDSVLSYSAWNSQTKDFSLNSQRVVYNKRFDNHILSCVFYKWNLLNANWEVSQHFLFADYLAASANSIK